MVAALQTPPGFRGKDSAPHTPLPSRALRNSFDDDKSSEAGSEAVLSTTDAPESPTCEETQRGLEKLTVLATDLMSPQKTHKKERKERRTVRFDHTSLPPELNLDNIASATIFHAGRRLELERAKKKPGQHGYQILTPKVVGGEAPMALTVDAEQAYKMVFREENGNTFTFTGAQNLAKYPVCDDSDEDSEAKYVMTIAPIAKEQLLRIRMDLLVNRHRSLTALLLSAGKKPSSSALMRFYGLADTRRQGSATWSLRDVFSLVTQLSLLVLFVALFRSPVESIYNRYSLTHDADLVQGTQDLVRRSHILRHNFGSPLFSDNMFAYDIDMYSSERASFSIPFTIETAEKKQGTEWELEGTKAINDPLDEITVTFDGDFSFGTAQVEAYKADETWHFSSLKLDLATHEPNYADSLSEYLIGWMTSVLSSLSSFHITLEDPDPHFRIKMEIGHDHDRDGDADHAVSDIIQEKSQLVHDKRVIGYIRPDDDVSE